MKPSQSAIEARALAESFSLKTRTLKDGRVQVVHPVSGKWTEVASRADVRRMTEATEKTKVIFRKFPKSKGGEVIALFPEEPGSVSDLSTCTSYAHCGQHGQASVYIAEWTRPATPEEYAPLKRELEGAPYHYDLEVIQRFSPKHWEARKSALAPADVEKWPCLCKRTEDPKLSWLERQLTKAGLRHARSEFPSAHAPRLMIHPDDEERALAILIPVDDIPDHYKRWLKD